MGVEEDRISILPDSLIHHIFSFLPIKNVVATSLVSKRWKHLWISTPVIKIQNWRREIETENAKDSFQETLGLMNFLNKMLPLSSSAVPTVTTIKKFYLKYRVYPGSEYRLFNDSRIDAWIATLVMREVEELSLCLTMNFKLPPCLFTSDTLTMLEIEMSEDLSAKVKRRGTLSLPQEISLPSLKILHFKHMVFVDDSLNAQLISRCPVLEELILTHCYLMKKKVLEISVASLKRLSITNCKKFSYRIKIDSPSLQSLTYIGMPEDYVLMDHTLSSLVNADVDIAFERLNKKTKGRDERQCGLQNLLGGISNAKLLKISGSTLDSLLFEGFFTSQLRSHLPTFHNLKRLHVSSKMSSETVEALVYFLCTLPNLESIVISQGFSDFEKVNDFGRQNAPECLFPQLKAVEVREFDGMMAGEMNVINFFLKESLSLQTMDIVFSSFQNLKSSMNEEHTQLLAEMLRKDVKRQILMFPKCSRNCVISFSW